MWRHYVETSASVNSLPWRLEGCYFRWQSIYQGILNHSVSHSAWISLFSTWTIQRMRWKTISNCNKIAFISRTRLFKKSNRKYVYFQLSTSLIYGYKSYPGFTVSSLLWILSSTPTPTPWSSSASPSSSPPALLLTWASCALALLLPQLRSSMDSAVSFDF